MKRGLVAFFIVMPVIALSLFISAYYYNLDLEHHKSQLVVIQALREKQIDNSIKKSLKELLEYQSNLKMPSCQDTYVNGVKIPGKITVTAARISGNGIAIPGTWQHDITQMYAKQEIEVKFYIFAKRKGGDFKEVLEHSFYSELLNSTTGAANFILTCNEATGVITNGVNAEVLNYVSELDELPQDIIYTVKDTNTGQDWEEVIEANLLNPTDVNLK